MVESAKGLELHLADGRTVLDACGGAAVAIISHGNKEVQKAMIRQASKVSYVHTQSYTTTAAEDLTWPISYSKELRMGWKRHSLSAVAAKLSSQRSN